MPYRADADVLCKPRALPWADMSGPFRAGIRRVVYYNDKMLFGLTAILLMGEEALVQTMTNDWFMTVLL